MFLPQVVDQGGARLLRGRLVAAAAHELGINETKARQHLSGAVPPDGPSERGASRLPAGPGWLTPGRRAVVVPSPPSLSSFHTSAQRDPLAAISGPAGDGAQAACQPIILPSYWGNYPVPRQRHVASTPTSAHSPDVRLTEPHTQVSVPPPCTLTATTRPASPTLSCGSQPGPEGSQNAMLPLVSETPRTSW